MIGLPQNIPIFLCTQPVAFRKGFDGLTGIVIASMGQNVTDGSLFLFVNCRCDRINALWWETGGFWRSARAILRAVIVTEHPDRDRERVAVEIFRRISSPGRNVSD